MGRRNCSEAMPPQASMKSPRLELGRAGGVVADDDVDEAGREAAPELLAIFALADRRGAFVLGVAVRDGLGVEVEVVRRGLGA